MAVCLPEKHSPGATTAFSAEHICALAAGRNIHALDPYRMPSQAALERGSAVAQGIIDSHMQGAAGAYPETVAVRP